MREAFSEYLHVVCPAALIEEGNHLVNCFESCMPSAPVLVLAEGDTHARAIVACRPSFVSGVRKIIAGQAVLEGPAWNQDLRDKTTGEVTGKMVDTAKAGSARSKIMLLNKIPDGWVMPIDKIVVAVNCDPWAG